MTDIRLLVDARNRLGEGPVWDVAEQALYWVDIEGCRLFRRDHATGLVRDWQFPERIGSYAIRRSGGLVCAFASGFAFFDPASGAIEWIARPEAMIARNRFNDGKCDRAGRFWAGTMDDRLKEHTGSLYRLDPDRSVHRMDGAIGVPNSLAWSPDDRVFYFADTLDGLIYAYDYDRATGAIANKRAFSAAKDVAGVPDGSTIDAEGYLWNARWDGWCVVRYAPDGRVDRVVELPVQKPTSCAFGGADLATLYVTSAVWDLSGSALARQPWAGGVLAVDAGVRGLPEPRFAG